ncbi:MAG: endopeptidase La [Saprospiraceae bacterium]
MSHFFQELSELINENIEFGAMMPLEEEKEREAKDYPSVLPVLALKNTVLFPGVVIPITIGRNKSITAVNKAFKDHKLIAVSSQKDTTNEDPSGEDLFEIGSVARIVKMLKMPDGSTTAILHGNNRFRLDGLTMEEPYLEGKISIIPDVKSESLEFEALMSSVKDTSRKIIELSPQIPSEAVAMIDNIDNTSYLLNFISSNLNLDKIKKQALLEEVDVYKRAEIVMVQLNSELQLLELRTKIENRVRTDIEKQQKDYFLNQQLKTIQDELGQNPQTEEINLLEAKGKKMKWPDTANQQFLKELNKVKRINPQVAEYSVTLNYLELMLDLPWETFSKDNFDLKKVRKTLDNEHTGLDDVKDRIIEHLAVLKLKGDMKSPIICLVGPPGVGKTSLGKSIAEALNRKFARMSLGGLHDESEIRGHRKTYIGAMPGRILKSLKKAKTSNPVFILDEIDKLGKDFRGDPSSALLEVLDPEQNSTFYDNYLEMEYDLSKILFIATANSLGSIQPALLDRMEIIEMSGYSTEEKINIASKHLVPDQRKNHGLKASHIGISKSTIKSLIENYTRESGVRSLNREIGSVMRSIAKNVAMELEYNKNVKPEHLEDILGPTKFSKEKYTKYRMSGVCVGLAWTRVGGDILFVETSLSKGKGKLTLTGNLGDVMKESATTALSYIKANHESLGIDGEILSTKDVHIHVPQGAIPKDGPSAGITMLTALTSAFTGKKVKDAIAMTGEITLRGRVLPVGGIKEKMLAAKRAGIKKIILCAENEKNVKQIPEEYLKGMEFIYVEYASEVISYALGIR